jgi:hypothetical protein
MPVVLFLFLLVPNGEGLDNVLAFSDSTALVSYSNVD